MFREAPTNGFGPGKCGQSRSYKQPYKRVAFSGLFQVGKGDFLS